MSAPVCPDCNGTDFKGGGPLEQCKICGWKGMLCPAEYGWTQELADQSKERLKLVEEGKLFTLRFEADGDDDDIDQAYDQVQKILKTEAKRTAVGAWVVQVTKKPTPMLISKLKMVTTVIKVMVFPGKEE